MMMYIVDVVGVAVAVAVDDVVDVAADKVNDEVDLGGKAEIEDVNVKSETKRKIQEQLKVVDNYMKNLNQPQSTV